MLFTPQSFHSKLSLALLPVVLCCHCLLMSLYCTVGAAEQGKIMIQLHWYALASLILSFKQREICIICTAVQTQVKGIGCCQGTFSAGKYKQ